MLAGQSLLDAHLALEQAVHRFVAMGLNVHRSLDPALFPQRGVGILVGKKEVAALIDEASGDHGQHVFDPGFWPGIKRPVQFEFFGQLQHGATGAVFPGPKDLERVGVALGQSLSGESRLDEFELLQVQAGDAAMVGVQDVALEAEGGAEEADRVEAVGLDFEMDRADRFHNGYRIRYNACCVNRIIIYVWLQLNPEIKVNPLRIRKLLRFREGKMRLAPPPPPARPRRHAHTYEGRF